MATASRFETLTLRYAAIQERTDRFVYDLRCMIQLLEHDIDCEEKRTGISDLANSNYSVAARLLRARRDHLAATIGELEEKTRATRH